MLDSTQHHESQDILACTEPLRALVKDLVRDEQVVDDVIQETRLEMLRRRPGGDRMRWARAVARNIARTMSRTSERRRRREYATAKTDSSPSASDAVERLEKLRGLIDALEALPSPYREVMCHRYLDDAPPREIAQDLDIPLATVKVRLKRGLRQLRTRLDREHGGNRIAWCLPLLPLAGLGVGPIAATGNAGATVAGVAIMKTKIALALTLVLVLGVGWFLGTVILDDEAGPTQSEVSANAGDPKLRTDDGQAQVASQGQAKPSIATRRFGEPVNPGGFAIPIHTLRGDRRAYPNVRITARIHLGYAPPWQVPPGEPLHEEQLTSNEQGRIDWQPDLPEGACVLWFSGPSEGHWSLPAFLPVVPPHLPSEPIEVFALPLDACVQGLVTNESGEPLVGARVRTRFADVSTDPRGRYRIAMPSDRRSTQVWANAAGWEQKALTARDLKAGATLRLDFSLSAGTVVSGRVIDESGNPVADAMVRSNDVYVETRSDTGGRYTLTGLPARSERFGVYARKDGFLEAKVSMSLPLEGEAPELVMKRGVAVRGRVLGPDGSPVRGASLYIGFSPSAYNRLDAVSDNYGQFAFPCVAPGKHTVVTQARGLSPSKQVIEVPSDRPATEIDIHLDAGRFIAGRCEDSKGVALEGVSIAVRHHGEYVDALKGRTGSDGGFRIDGLPDDSVGLEFYATSITRHVHEVQEVDRDDLVVVLRRPGSVAGRVIDADTDEPLPNFRVRFVAAEVQANEKAAYVHRPPWAAGGRAFETSDGRWSTGTARLEIGSIIGLEIRADGYVPEIVPRVVVSEGADPDALVIRMQPGGVVTGRVVEAGTGGGVGFATLSLVASHLPYPHEWPGRLERGAFAGARPSAKTEDDGSFHLTDVPNTTFFLVVQPKGGAGHHLVGPFTAPVTDPLVVTLGLGSRVSGVALDDSGRPCPGATIRLWEQRRPDTDPMVRSYDRSRRTRAGSDGRFVIEGVGPGNYVVGRAIEFLDRETIAFAAYVTVQENAPLEVRLGPAGTGGIRGRIEGLDDVQRETLVQASRGSKRGEPRTWRRRALVTTDGTFEFRGLEPGRWTIRVSTGSTRESLRGNARVEVTDGAVVSVSVAISK